MLAYLIHCHPSLCNTDPKASQQKLLLMLFLLNFTIDMFKQSSNCFSLSNNNTEFSCEKSCVCVCVEALQEQLGESFLSPTSKTHFMSKVQPGLFDVILQVSVSCEALDIVCWSKTLRSSVASDSTQL